MYGESGRNELALLVSVHIKVPAVTTTVVDEETEVLGDLSKVDQVLKVTPAAQTWSRQPLF